MILRDFMLHEILIRPQKYNFDTITLTNNYYDIINSFFYIKYEITV